MKIDEILIQWCNSLRLTQTAPYFGVSQSTYHNWEAEKAKPQFKHLPKIAHICQIDIARIIPDDLQVALNAPSMPQETVEINALKLLKKLQDGKDALIGHLKKQIEVLHLDIGLLQMGQNAKDEQIAALLAELEGLKEGK